MGKLTPGELESITKKDSLAFGIAYVDLLDAKLWSVNDRKWMVEPYKALNPYEIEKNPLGKARRLAITKSTQAGISTMAIVKALHFMSYWEVRIGYMLPRQKDLSDFSATRLEPIIQGSEFLSSRRGEPNSVFTKRLGKSYIFFLEGSVEPRSMPMDALYLDEVDLCNPDHVGTAINRLDASPWHLLTYLSTPTLPMLGIDAVFETSDQREWVIPCPHCGHKQIMDWEKNLCVTGPANDPTSVYYGCVSCKKEITVTDIQCGQWVAQFPTRSDDIAGYHISQMMTTEARALYKHFRDPNQSMSEFYRKRLGRPYTIKGGSLEREDILINCFEEPYEPEDFHDGEFAYYMGVDQGNQLQVIVAKVPPNRRSPKAVHIELVPFEEGFARIAKLMRLYKVRRAVIDGDPNRHSVKELQAEFPARILMADYIEHRERYILKKESGSKVNTHVTINRTEGFDDLVSSIRKGWLQLPGDPTRMLPEVEVFIDQLTSIKRDLEKRNTPSGEIEVAVWRKLRADHLAHASLYMKIAIDVDQGRGFRTAVVNVRRASDGAAVDATAYTPHSDIAIPLIALFAEVPIEQIKSYLVHSTDGDYVMPFPLSHKMEQARLANYESFDVSWALFTLLKIM